ncbi:galectin-3-like [Drosophila erecta]|uniref:GG11329 n=1 Tax=Drosophila erecta TaxID=7220 RepID=B3P6W6_DROER|nr:galectin-3-like [Drosophila erecta]
MKYTRRELLGLSIPKDAMFRRRVVAFAALALIQIASGQASQFNLASTLTGGITSSRHRQRANLNSQLYPGLAQVGSGYACAGVPGYFPGTGAYPSYPYPGVYLQQYPGYPQPAQLPAYLVVPGAVAQPGVPGVAGVPGVQAGVLRAGGPLSFHKLPWEENEWEELTE